jgi:hypothetical protein
MLFRGLAVPHLPNFKALELRVIQIQRIVDARPETPLTLPSVARFP